MFMNRQRIIHVMRTPLQEEIAPAGRSSLRQRLRGAFARARCRARLRRDPGRLDERAIHDMGARRLDLEAEAAKPFWRA